MINDFRKAAIDSANAAMRFRGRALLNRRAISGQPMPFGVGL
jgi:hypothetical protein